MAPPFLVGKRPLFLALCYLTLLASWDVALAETAGSKATSKTVEDDVEIGAVGEAVKEDKEIPVIFTTSGGKQKGSEAASTTTKYFFGSGKQVLDVDPVGGDRQPQLLVVKDPPPITVDKRIHERMADVKAEVVGSSSPSSRRLQSFDHLARRGPAYLPPKEIRPVSPKQQDPKLRERISELIKKPEAPGSEEEAAGRDLGRKKGGGAGGPAFFFPKEPNLNEHLADIAAAAATTTTTKKQSEAVAAPAAPPQDKSSEAPLQGWIRYLLKGKSAAPPPPAAPAEPSSPIANPGLRPSIDVERLQVLSKGGGASSAASSGLHQQKADEKKDETIQGGPAEGGRLRRKAPFALF